MCMLTLPAKRMERLAGQARGGEVQHGPSAKDQILLYEDTREALDSLVNHVFLHGGITQKKAGTTRWVHEIRRNRVNTDSNLGGLLDHSRHIGGLSVGEPHH